MSKGRIYQGFRWRSIKDELPIKGQSELLVCLSNNAVFQAHYHTSKFYSTEHGYFKDTNPVTHWANEPKGANDTED